MSFERAAPVWASDRISDPDGDYLWLAVDAFTEAEARVEAADGGFRPCGPVEHMVLRWLDPEHDDDAYLMEEWGATATAVGVPPSDPAGRTFWSFEYATDATAMDVSG